MTDNSKAIQEKKSIAITSVAAAVFLVTFKLIIGIATGSLGILSEALHSALDLVAALITYFAVRFADLPADEEHHYGHGKIENYSALIETFLLLITCFWIIYEAINRLLTGEVEIEVTVWSFIVIITSIVIDISRSRALYKVARKYNSQALEADALHFSTDIWSSTVVLIGLICVSFFKFHFADPIAALLVALIVLGISYRLGKRSFDALMDRAPKGLTEDLKNIISGIPEVKGFHELKVRESGPYKFVEFNIHVEKDLSIYVAHEISHKVEEAITDKINNIQVTIHIEPDE
ncbi:MAG: cation transporter [Flavobacterium sp.]|nr:cation transporter [Flavobacterium sp.]